MEKKFLESILRYVASQIRENKILPKDTLIKYVWNDCFPQGSEEEYGELEHLIAQHIDHVLDPQVSQPIVRFLDHKCEGCSDQLRHCLACCPTDAISVDEHGSHTIDYELCIDCGHCVDACISGIIVEHSDFARVAKMLAEEGEAPAYAILAPSFVGQFGDIEPERIKGTFRLLGFTDVYEVALAADVITGLEAQEFYRKIYEGAEFMITSCCCPAFIKLVEKRRPSLTKVISESVSPMIALGRMLKSKEPDCRVVFIGPCVAKKAEARRPDLSDAIDCVLTFKETKVLLEVAGLSSLSTVKALELEDASHDGRIFAHTGGVTTAIMRAVHEIDPNLEVIPVQGNGIKECSELLKKAEEGTLGANFMEGMACPGGCVGGPGTVIASDQGAVFVDAHARQSLFPTSYANEQAHRWFTAYMNKDKLFSPKQHISQR